MVKSIKIWIVLLLSLLVAQLSAQAWDNYVLPAEIPSDIDFTSRKEYITDFQTVGSYAPYYVTPDTTIKNQIGSYASRMPFRNSLFQWAVLSDTNTLVPSDKGIVTKINTENIETLTKDSGQYVSGLKYYSENLIRVNWKDTGTYFVGVAEQYQLNIGSQDEPVKEQYGFTQVVVLPQPKYAFATDNKMQICKPATDQNVYVPIQLAGIGDFNLKIKVDFYQQVLINGGTLTRTEDFEYVKSNLDTLDENWNYGQAAAKYSATKLYADRDGLEISIPSTDTWGRYEISVTYLTDAVSRKSDVNGKVLNSTVADKFYIYVMPTTTDPQLIHKGVIKGVK